MGQEEKIKKVEKENKDKGTYCQETNIEFGTL